jgi:hypothetical protein
MFLSRFIFKIIISIPFILIFNGLLIGLLFSLVHQGLTIECVTMIKRLRLETLSSTLVVWGVILESRELIIAKISKSDGGHISKQAHDEIQYYGISLVALGLIVEVTDYVNNQLQTDGMSMLAFEATALIQWLVLVVVLIDTCGLSLVLLTSLWRQLKNEP